MYHDSLVREDEVKRLLTGFHEFSDAGAQGNQRRSAVKVEKPRRIRRTDRPSITELLDVHRLKCNEVLRAPSRRSGEREETLKEKTLEKMPLRLRVDVGYRWTNAPLPRSEARPGRSWKPHAHAGIYVRTAAAMKNIEELRVAPPAVAAADGRYAGKRRAYDRIAELDDFFTRSDCRNLVIARWITRARIRPDERPRFRWARGIDVGALLL